MFSTLNRRLVSSLCSKSPYLFKDFENIEKISNGLFLVQQKRFKHFKYAVKDGVLKEISPTSRYIPKKPNEYLEETLLSTLKSKTFMNEEDWDKLKSDVIDQGEHVSEENFSTIVMNSLLSSNRLDLGYSFLKYLEQSSVKPNFLTYLKYISLCSFNHGVIDQEHLFSVLDKVIIQIDKSPILDMKRAEYVIQGFCATDRWKESFKYLDKLVDSKPSREICNALACAAIRNGDEIFAWEILMRWRSCYETVSDKVIQEFLLVALKMQKSDYKKSDAFIVKLFDYMQKRSTTICEGVVKLIEQYFNCHRFKWNITYTKVTRQGFCESCNHGLKHSQLQDEEFVSLRDAFLERAVKKSDLFINTTEKEFDKYMKFIDKYKPFHVVIDGLNAAHTFCGYQSRKNCAYHLLDIIKILSRKSKKLLVLGREHMQDWPAHPMKEISQRAKLFFTDNLSEDDPFAVYAALASGPHTLFLSRDLLRDHLFLLEDPKSMHFFKKWQQSHQIFADCDNKKNIKFIEPVRHNITVQGNMQDGWHIPFDDKVMLDPYEELNNWLCIRNTFQ